MSTRRYDMRTGSWYELQEDEDGNLVEVRIENAGPEIAKPGPQETVVSAKIEQDPDFKGVPADNTNTRYGRELELASKMAMAEEQQREGFQYSLDHGFALATQNPEDEKKVANAARRSTKQACYEAGKILEEKATALADKDPAQAKLYFDYAAKINQFGDEIQTEFQDKWHGTNLRYGTPVGSGREGVPYSSARPGANNFIRPELAGKTYEQAMDDTLYTTYGKQTLGNRINTARNYQKNNNPWIQMAYSAVPLMNQYQNAQKEGLGIGDLSATGALGLIGSAGLQGLGEVMTAAGAYPLGIASIVGGEMFGMPDRPNSDEIVADVLKDTATSTLGAAVPNVAGVAGKKLLSKAGKKVAKEAVGDVADPKLETKIMQRQRDLEGAQAELAAQNAIVAGEPEAVQNAFVKAAAPGVAPDDAWKYYNGFIMGEDGLPKTFQNTPYVNYALKQENSLLRDQSDAAKKLANAKRDLSDQELALKQLKQNPPSEDIALRAEQYVKELKDLSLDKALDEGIELKEDIQMIETLIENLDKRPDVIRAQVEFRTKNIKDLEDALSEINKKKAPTEYAKTKLRLKKERSRLEYAQSVLDAKTENRRLLLERELKKKQDAYKKVEKTLDEMSDPKTKGFLTAQDKARGSRAAFENKQKEYSQRLQTRQQNYDNAEQVVSELEQKIKQTEEAISRIKSIETQESYKKGAESLLKKQAGGSVKILEKQLKAMEDELERLKSGRKVAGSSHSPSFMKRLLSGAARFAQGPVTSLGANQSRNSDVFMTAHKDYVADNNMTIGSPWLKVLEMIPLVTPNGTQERVNKYRGFNK